jgi:Ni,Fe-hydrogenase III small subunit
MKFSTMAIACAAFLIGALCTFLIMRAFDPAHGDLALIIGGILGTYTGVFFHHRQPASNPSLSAKVQLGLALAVVGGVFASMMQILTSWLEVPEITIAVAAVGCFCFPFAVFTTIWKALEDGRKQRDRKTEADPEADLPPD